MTLPFQALFYEAPDAIVTTDGAALVIGMNQQAERLFGYTEQELTGQSIELLLPEPVGMIRQLHDGAGADSPATSPPSTGVQFNGRCKDGSTFPADVSLRSVHTSAGRMIVSIIRDVSERKRVEEELRTSRARLSGVLEIADDAIISVDEAQRIQRFNHGAEKTFGYTATEVMGQPLDLLLPERFRTLHRQHVRAFGQSPEIARRMHERRAIFGRRKDGSEFPAEASISKLTVGGEHVYTVILHDITERKRQADELERQVQFRTAHLNALLQFSNELLLTRSIDDALSRALSHALALVPEAQRGAVYLDDGTGQQLVLRASVGFEQLPQSAVLSDEGFIGIAFTSRRPQLASSLDELELVSSKHAHHQSWLPEGVPQKALTGAAAIPLLSHDQPEGVLLLLREGGTGPFAAEAAATLQGLANLTAAAIVEEQNRHSAAALSSQLATLEEQQRTMAERLNYAEAGMLQAARLAAVGQLAASIAHEINNPLYAARNGLYLIEEDLPENLRSSPYLRMVSDQLARIATIIERMRDFYRPTRGELAPYDINQLLEETLALAGLNTRHGGITMVFTPAPDLPLVECNGDQLRQVFLNLILNAIEAMPNGGTLTVRSVAGPSVALIEIHDTGVGIPDDIRAHLFEPFFTNKPNGTGLGLSITAHIVTQHGGRIEVDSVVRQGTTFRIVLPYKPTM